MSVLQELHGVLKLRILQLLALSGLLSVLAAISIALKTSVLDPDIWWHIKVGDWIVQNLAVPQVGIFSRTAGTRPWVAYSWGYEVLASRVYAAFGLLGFGIFGIVLTLAVACVFFWMLYRLSRRRFWVAWIVGLFGSFAFLFSLFPRPVFFSMAFFMIALTLLLEVQRTGHIRPLYWLPLIFLFWANIHIQFIYGLFMVGLFVGIHVLDRLAQYKGITRSPLVPVQLPLKPLIVVFAASVLVCCVGPYSYHLYEVVFLYSKSKVPYTFIQELQPLGYTRPADYLLVLLTAAGFFAVGWQKRLDLFKLALLAVAALCAFRTARDAWFVAVCASAFIADLTADDRERRSFKLPELAGVTAVVALFLVLVARNTGFDTRNLDRAISKEFPVDAVNYLRRNPVPGPLYNDLNWGGFLIWYMPNYPVAIDGRNDLYGDELDTLFHQSVLGNYASNPYLKEAGVVLLPKIAPLATMLTVDPQFRVVYQDKLAIVFARR